MAITYEFNRYDKTPTMTVVIEGYEYYLSPFRGYRFQISTTKSGDGYIAASMTNTKMHELATLSCAHAILTKLALDCLREAADKESKIYRTNCSEDEEKFYRYGVRTGMHIDYDELHKFIDETIIFLKNNAESIDSHNDVYQAYDSYHCIDLTGG